MSANQNQRVTIEVDASTYIAIVMIVAFLVGFSLGALIP